MLNYSGIHLEFLIHIGKKTLIIHIQLRFNQDCSFCDKALQSLSLRILDVTCYAMVNRNYSATLTKLQITS